MLYCSGDVLFGVWCLTLLVTLPRAVRFAFGKEREVGLEDHFTLGCAFSKFPDSSEGRVCVCV